MKKKDKLKAIFNTQEGKILAAAFVFLYIFLAILAYSFYLDQVLGRTLLGAFVAHTFGGRAAGVGLCIAFEINIYWTILYNMFLEVLIVLFSYSLFLFSLNNYFKIKFINRAIKNAEKNARKTVYLG